MASERRTGTPPATRGRRRRNLALAVGGVVVLAGVAGVILAQTLRSHTAQVFVLSSPYIAGIQIAPSHLPEAAAWPLVSDGTTSGYVVGDTLSTTTGSWFADNGGGLHSISGYAYRWQRCGAESASCSAIAGATRPTYRLTSRDVGFAIRAVVIRRSAAGSIPQASAPTPRIGGSGRTSSCTFGVATAAVSSAGGATAERIRVIRVTPSASGPLTALSTYFARTGSAGPEIVRGVVYADSHGAPGALLGVSNEVVSSSPSPAWYTLTFPSSVRIVPAQSYWIGVLADSGSATAPSPSSLRSANADQPFPVCGIQAPAGSPVNAVAPAIFDLTRPGAWAAGDRLTASSGSWSPAALAYSYQWQRCDSIGTDCNDIGGATANSYILAANQVGGSVRVVVRATNGTGSGWASSALPLAGPRTVSRTPSGPPTPKGGWSVEYADAFGAPLGTGADHDNTIWPSRINGKCINNPGFNSDEMEVFNCSQVTVDPNGLQLACVYAPHIVSTKNYSCGAINTRSLHPFATARAGYRLFQFMPGHGSEWAIQISAKFPPNTGEADPGWWVTDPRWTWEIDMFEGFGASAGSGGTWCHPVSGNTWIGVTDPTWIYRTEPRSSIRAEQMLCRDAQPSPFDPSAGYHTYTTVIYPNNTLSEYIDGHIQAWDYVPAGGNSHVRGGTVIGPPGASPATYGGLIISYALRDTVTGNPDPYFTSGARSMSVRSIAVYESATARGAGTVNGGLIAPGTSLSP